jgi:hypothetical protein
MRLDEYQIANALIDTRLVMTSRLLSSDWSVTAGPFMRSNRENRASQGSMSALA